MMHCNDQLYLPGDNGIGIVLIHGISSGCAQMIPLGKMLNDYLYSVHCVNIAGHGTYPQELLRTSFEDMIDKASYDYDMMKRHYDKVYIGGLSMGGCLALALASKRDDIDGIFSISAPLDMVPGGFVTAEYPEDMISFHRDIGGKVGIARWYHIHYEDIAVRVCKELINLMDYLKTDGVIENIKCPSYIAQSQDDAMADPTSCYRIMERLTVDDKYLYNPLDAGHNMAFNEGRFGLIQNLIAYLNAKDHILE